MESKIRSVAGLYYRYKKVSDQDIREHLDRTKIVHRKVISGIEGLYPLTDKMIDLIKKNPRGKSLTFDATILDATPILGLTFYKEINYLVKSSSRFFLKPDIGEIFDQIGFGDLMCKGTIKAIEFINECDTIPETEDEHFIMKANLFS